MAFDRYLRRSGGRLAAIRIEHVDAFMATFNAPYARSTQRLYRSYLRGFLRYLYHERHLLPRDLAALVVGPPMFAKAKPPKFLRPHEIQRLFAQLPYGTARELRTYASDNVDEVDARGPVLAALDALHDFSPDAALDKARALASTGQGALADLAGAWLSVKRGNATNLAANPGFEEADANEERPEADWETEGAPSGWSVWHRAGDGTRFYTAKGKGVDDTIGAGIEAAGSACYLQTIDVKPGQRYMCTVRVRRWHAGMDASGRLAVRWRTADGAWYEGGATEPSTTLQGTGSQWQPMALIAEVPEGATSLVLMLSAQYLGDESAILFDNAAVYRLPDAK